MYKDDLKFKMVDKRCVFIFKWKQDTYLIYNLFQYVVGIIID